MLHNAHVMDYRSELAWQEYLAESTAMTRFFYQDEIKL